MVGSAVEQGEAYPNFPRESFACNNRKVAATVVYYTSEPNFTGADAMTLEGFGVHGVFWHQDYVINVR